MFTFMNEMLGIMPKDSGLCIVSEKINLMMTVCLKRCLHHILLLYSCLHLMLRYLSFEMCKTDKRRITF